MLKLVNIKKDYKIASSKVQALKGVNLCFRENEFVGILGQSGCGKTTLLNIIGGLDHYTEGDLVIEGKSTKNFSDRDWDVYRNHRIGFIFQSYNLIPHQSVLGNVELALTIAGISREERVARAKEALERVGLGKEMNKRPNQLSGGQMQRVAIARALVNNPAILLADEPTGALDSKTSVEVMELIREIAGERLVVMVTHNPELAESYATRIVRLKDGEVESDSNPYSEEDEEKERLLPPPEVNAEENVKESEKKPVPEQQTEKPQKKKKPRAKMGFFTALALSFRNLLTKKGRTILTSLGGSIGIISVCLVLALSNGFNHYIQKTEEDMLSYYPVQVTESTFDMASVMTSFTAPKDMPDLNEIGDRVYVDSFLTGLANDMAIQNNISDQYVDYVKKMDPSMYAEMQFGYGASLANNIYLKVNRGDFDVKNENTGHYEHIPLSPEQLSISELKKKYIQDLRNYKAEYASLTGFADFFGNIVHKMPGTSNFDDKERYASYVLSQYDVLDPETMHFPENENEAVLVVSSDRAATDLLLAQLGILDEKDFLSLFDKGKPDATEEEKKPIYIPYKDILGKEYKLLYNDTVYLENEEYKNASSDMERIGKYPFDYKSSFKSKTPETPEVEEEWTTLTSEDGINMKITAILSLKEGLNYGCLQNGLNITEAAVDRYVQSNLDSKIVKWILEKSAFEINNPQDPLSKMKVYLSPCNASQFDDYYFAISQFVPDAGGTPYGNLRVAAEIEQVVRSLGGDDSYSSVSLYARDFEGKEKMLAYLDEWNAMCERGATYELEGHDPLVLGEKDKITYSDTVGVLMSMVQTMLNAITYVLVAFTAISLVVSSVMIGIITYVSVVERVKEIGVLRALGARKRDIKNLFNAETFIIGLGAGLIGVVVSYVLSFLINAILNPLTGIIGLASLNPVAALIMVLISVGLTLVSGLIPASAAAKKDPVIALRTE